MTFMPTGTPGIGDAMVRVGADFRGMSAATTKAMTQFRGQMAAGTAGLGAASQNAAVLGNNMDGAAKKASKLGLAIRGMAIGLGAVGVGLGVMAIKAAIDFESAFAGVKKTVDASEQTLERLRQSFLDLSREIPVTASALAGIGEAAGALGVPTESILEFTKVVSTIGTTTDISVEEAGTALGQLSNVLNMTSADYGRFASTLVDLGNKGASTESQIIEITRRMGSAAKLMGIQTSQILALGSAAANLGMQPQLAASSLQRLIMRLLTVSGGFDTVAQVIGKAGISLEQFKEIVEEGDERLDKLATIAGFTPTELKKMAAGLASLDALKDALGLTQKQFDKLKKQHPERIIEGMFRGMQGMDASERQTFISRLMGPAASAGGGVGLQQLMLGLADSVDRNLTPSLRNATFAWEANNAAAKEAEQRYKTTSSQLTQLRNDFTAVLIDAGTGSLPMVADVLGKIREAIPAIVAAIGNVWDTIQGPLQQVGDAAYKLSDTLAEILFDWGEGGKADGLLGSLDVMAELTGTIANWLGAILDHTNSLLSTPVIGGLAKMAVMWGGIALAFKGMMGLRNLVGGAAMGLGGILGAPARSLARSLSPGDKMQIEAAAMQQKAAATNMAAAGQEAAAAAAMTRSAALRGAGPYALPMHGTAGAAAATAAMNARAAAMGAGAMTVGISKMQNMRAMAAGAMTRISSGISAGMGLISRAFWPLFIADLAGNLIAAPIGDFIANNTGMKRLAKEWQKGWIDGIAATIQTVVRGSDVDVGRPQNYSIGGNSADGGTLDINREILRATAAATGEQDTLTELLDAIDNADTEQGLIVASASLAEWISTQKEVIVQYNDGVVATLVELSKNNDYVGLVAFKIAMATNALSAAPGAEVLQSALDASREELQDLAIKIFRDAGIDVPLQRIAAMTIPALNDLMEAMAAMPTDAPAGLAERLARGMVGVTGITGASGDPFGALKANVAGLTDEMEGLEQSLATLDPALRKLLEVNFTPELLAQIEDADTNKAKASILRSLTNMFPEAKDLKGSQTRKLDRLWSELLEGVSFTKATLGLNTRKDIAKRMTQALSESIGEELTSGNMQASLFDMIEAIGPLLEDGIGESDTEERIAAAISKALAAGIKAAGDDPKKRKQLKENVKALMRTAGIEATADLNIPDLILASRAGQLRDMTPKEQRQALRKMRNQFGKEAVPKNIKQLQARLEAPEVKNWETYFTSLQNVINTTGTETATQTTTITDSIKADVKSLPGAITETTTLAGPAAQGLETSIAAPIENLASRITTAVSTAIAELNRLAEAQAIADYNTETRSRTEADGPQAGPSPDYDKPPGTYQGGRAYRGIARMVGEKGAELFMPDMTGTIIPSGKSMDIAAALAGGMPGGGSVSVSSSSRINAPSQTLYIDRMELHGPADENSVLASLNFLAPLGV